MHFRKDKRTSKKREKKKPSCEAETARQHWREKADQGIRNKDHAGLHKVYLDYTYAWAYFSLLILTGTDNPTSMLPHSHILWNRGAACKLSVGDGWKNIWEFSGTLLVCKKQKCGRDLEILPSIVWFTNTDIALTPETSTSKVDATSLSMVPCGNSPLLTRSDRNRLKSKMNADFYKEKTAFPQFFLKKSVFQLALLIHTLLQDVWTFKRAAVLTSSFVCRV